GANRSSDRHEGRCSCGERCFYCIRCLQMGKIKRCSKLYWLPDQSLENAEKSKTSLLAWTGELSEQQNEASLEIIEAISENRTHLVWAVAGAGKTEMLFKGIELALKDGKRICVASPRVDVCLELAPRLAAAFPDVPIAVLHGGMEKPYCYTPLVIATTHQLLRFREAFDVLVVDEVDAFPFHLDETLHYGAEKARKKRSSLIYLSATPDDGLQRKIHKGTMTASILPARYHRNPLPVPECKWPGNWKKQTLKYPRFSVPIQLMRRWLQMERRFLVFVPNIEWMKEFEGVCRKVFQHASFTAVSSEDPERKEKVLGMRREDYQFLITTTILERGVTFPDVHVIVLGAEDRTYTEAALVQIAGRAGRSPLFPKGEVVFLHQGKTKAMKKAIGQIRQMNRLGLEKGYIKI